MMKTSHYLLSKNVQTFLYHKYTVQKNEIETLINVLNKNKASGNDVISHIILNGVLNSISKPLSAPMNRSFDDGVENG